MGRVIPGWLFAAVAVAAGLGTGCGEEVCAEEVCNGIDDDCDGEVDEGLIQHCATACGEGTRGCVGGDWTTCSAPSPLPEICNGEDDDCDGRTDEGVLGRWYPDVDGDTYGDMHGYVDACTAPTGYIEEGGDCDDEDEEIHPGVEEVCDGRDEDCSGVPDEGCSCLPGETRPCGDWSDIPPCARGVEACDGGTWGECTGGVRPIEETCNGVDDDCDGTVDDEVPPDAHEPDDECSAARSLGTIDENESLEPMSSVVDSSLLRADGDDDVDWYRVVAEEESRACVPFTSECCYRFTVLLVPPPRVDRSEMRVCLYWDGGCGGFSGQTCSVSSDWDGTRGGYVLTTCWSGTCAYDDSRDIWIQVEATGSGAATCEPYLLFYNFYRTGSDC